MKKIREMFEAIFVVYFCVVSVNHSGLTDAKPIGGLQTSENPQVTTIQIPRSIISREELIALGQYVMRMMTPRINITSQTTTSHTDISQFTDNSQINSGVNVQSTTPTVISSNYYETFGKMKKMNYELTRYADQKSQRPCEKASETETSGLFGQVPGVTDSGKAVINNGARLRYEPFVRYAEKNIHPFPNQFGFEIIPNSEIPTTYVPQVGKGTGDLPLMEHVVNNPSLTSTVPSPIRSMTGEKDLPSSNIRISNLTIEQIPFSQPGNTLMSVPFEAIITFTRQKPSSLKPEIENQNIVIIPTRSPPDEFPPYFETGLPVAKETSDYTSSPLILNPKKSLNPVGDLDNKVVADNKQEVIKPTRKRQSQKVGELLGMLGLTTRRTKGSHKGSEIILTPPTPSSPTIHPQRFTKPQTYSTIKFEEPITTTPKIDPMFQRQEIEEDEEEDGGSLGSVADLLPLVAPILEDLSDPNTETDLVELLEAGLPLVQGISQGDGENDGIDLIGLLTPIISSLSGPNRNGNGTVFQAVLPLVLPLLTPFIGPIVGPILQGSSTPDGQGGSLITPLIQALAGPLSLPARPGELPIASTLISGIIAGLSKELKGGSGNGGGSDSSALVSALVSGVLAGGSASIKAKFPKPPPPPPPAYTRYGPYGQATVPASSVDTVDLVSTSFKEILGLSLQLIKSVVGSVTGILGASSSKQPKPEYGPANANYYVK